MNEKKGMEFSFTWLFVLLVGSAILFIAIFAATRILDLGTEEYQTKLAAELGTILSPLETSLESGKYYTIKMPDETRLFNNCEEAGPFGKQEISLSVKSGLGKEWQRSGVPYSSSNKYVFSDEIVQGKNLDVFVKPFNFPYKIGDLIIIYNKKYCFVSPPEDVEDEILSFGLRNVNISKNKNNCPIDSTSVCFKSTGCDINVFIDDDKSGSIKKNKKTLYYYDSLLYAGIFSEPELYECQLTRLRKRASQLALLYAEKTQFSSERCGSGFADELELFANRLGNENIRFTDVAFEAEEIGEKNERLSCPLF